MLPLVFALAIVLVVLGWPRGAAAWLLAAIATLATMLVLKVLAVACGPPELHSPSGHTGTAAFVVGGFAALLARRAGRGAFAGAVCRRCRGVGDRHVASGAGVAHLGRGHRRGGHRLRRGAGPLLAGWSCTVAIDVPLGGGDGALRAGCVSRSASQCRAAYPVQRLALGPAPGGLPGRTIGSRGPAAGSRLAARAGQCHHRGRAEREPKAGNENRDRILRHVRLRAARPAGARTDPGKVTAGGGCPAQERWRRIRDPRGRRLALLQKANRSFSD